MIYLCSFLVLSLPAVLYNIVLPQKSKSCKNYETNNRTICVNVIIICCMDSV